jgi:protein-tyrosine phosphatase
VSAPNWIDLDGTVNARDTGGLPTASGQLTVSHRLLRSDNLQDLSEPDISRLVGEFGLRDIVDLRTPNEVDGEGPGPIIGHSEVVVHNLSLYVQGGRRTDVEADALTGADAEKPTPTTPPNVDESTVLPWQGRPDEWVEGSPAVGFYLRYLVDRPDSVLEALRVIAHSAGSTLVHCAAGKDRTGVVVALALEVVGVPRDIVVADYAATGEKLELILTRLRGTETYRADLDARPADSHMPRPETMAKFLNVIDERFGGALAWLTAEGWTEADTAALRAKLLNP